MLTELDTALHVAVTCTSTLRSVLTELDTALHIAVTCTSTLRSVLTELETALHVAVTCASTLRNVLTSGTTAYSDWLRVGGPGIEHHSERYFSRLSGATLRPDHTRVQWVPGFWGWGVTLTTHPQLTPRLTKGYNYRVRHITLPILKVG